MDRNNSEVSYLFSPFHPAFIHILKEIRQEAAKIGKEVTICGEMAGKCFQALMLLGMGFTNFSMNAMAIAEIKRVFTQIHYSASEKDRQLNWINSARVRKSRNSSPNRC